jgi:hypothetical protein
VAFFMFVDESGQDQKESPYEVLAGVVIEDKKLWPLVRDLHKAELTFFGCRYANDTRELKAYKLLKTKVFRQAAWAETLDPDERRKLATKCLASGAGAPPRQQAALAQAKLAYAPKVLELAAAADCKAFAMITPKEAPRPTDDYLRRDYSFLFERFYFLLAEQAGSPSGIVVFDELERSKSHLLIGQMERYFMETRKGKARRKRVIPEPFFVHSHLTTGIHLPDLAAYVISWGLRMAPMTEPARGELANLARLTRDLAYDMTVRERGRPRKVWAFYYLKDLRPTHSRPKEKAM